MSADRLREAARVLRESAEAATPGPWCVADTTDPQSEWHDDYDAPMVVTDDSWPGVRCEIAVCNQDGEREGAPDATYIATMHRIGPALADWLQALAVRGDEVTDSMPPLSSTVESVCRNTIDGWTHAHRIADLILGGAS